MPEILNSDGTWTVLEREEYIRRFGEADWRVLTDPGTDPSDMTEGQKYLANKMQAEQEVNSAAAAAGLDSIFDLPSEDDDESISLDDLPRQEYDDEGAAADLEARRETP